MCSFGYFGKTDQIKTEHLISSKNSQSLIIEKDAIRESLDLQIKHVSGTELKTTDKKVHELLFSKINLIKKEMKILDFVIIRGQQVFEEGKDINSVEIKLTDNRLQKFFDKYTISRIRFRPIGILIASSVLNETEKIFLQTTGFKSGKYGLLNNDYKQIIGIINLNQIENWKTFRKGFKWVDVTFQEQKDNKNTLHPSFSFISDNKGDVLYFSLKLIDTDNKIIKFAKNEKKFPIVEFITEFLG